MEVSNISNFQYYQNIYAFNRGKNFIPTHSAGSTAVAGQLGVLPANQTFGTYNAERIEQTKKSQELTKTEIVRPKFLELISGISSAKINSTHGIDIVSSNTNNPYLSNFRGEMGVNMPLGSSAIYENGGRTGASLNIIA